MKRLLDSFSLLFPEGEKFFMKAVMNYKDQIPEDMKEGIDNFMEDERRHTMWHKAYNNLLGVDIESVNSEIKESLKKGGTSERDCLKTTMVLEALTKLGAHLLLIKGVSPLALIGTPEPMKGRWIQHAVEEISHVPEVHKLGRRLGITNVELILHAPKVLNLFVKQTSANYRRLKKS